MRLESRQELGKDIAELVLAAEDKFGPREGRRKLAWCVRQAQKRAPKGKNSSAEAGKWFGALLLRLSVEIAVATLKAYQERT